MNTTPIAKKTLHYRGYLNPKSYVPREAMFYFIGSSFFSLLLFLLVYFLGADPLFAVACGGAGAIGLLLVLIKINNRFFEHDKELLMQMIVTDKIDSIPLLSVFFKEIQLHFEQRSLAYFGTAESIHWQQVDLSLLFNRIFRQEGPSLLEKFKQQSGNYFRFIQELSLPQREILYRYYLTNVKSL